MSSILCEIENDIIKKNEDNLHIPKIDSTNLLYSEFFENYLLKNKPCILLNISNSWPCVKTWIEKQSPNFTYLAKSYGHLEITASDCNVKYYNAHEQKIISFKEYINYWEDYIKYNNSNSRSLLYLKDLHLKKRTNDHFYDVPKFFSSDWLNEYFSEKTDDDYKFVYMGPSGTWTPFHADVFKSFSWSVNICGKKRWLLFPPGEEVFLKDKFGSLPHDVTKIKFKGKCLEIDQNPGEAIFVPSGWHHQVHNLADTISINHNWVNGCNILNMWQSLITNLEMVKKEVCDLKELDGWWDNCQMLLKANFGLDFKMFYDFISFIARKRINYLLHDIEIKQFDIWILGKNHAKFDLLQIKKILELIIQQPDFTELNLTSYKTPQEILSLINKICI